MNFGAFRSAHSKPGACLESASALTLGRKSLHVLVLDYLKLCSGSNKDRRTRLSAKVWRWPAIDDVGVLNRLVRR